MTVTVQTLRSIMSELFANASVKVEDENGKEHEIKTIKQDIMRDVVVIIGD